MWGGAGESNWFDSWVLTFSSSIWPLLSLIFLLSSHFLKYQWKAVLEMVVSWICFVQLAGLLIGETSLGFAGIGMILACTFAAIGAVMKTILLKYGRFVFA